MSPKLIAIIGAAIVAVALAAPAHAQVDCADWNTGAFFEAADVSDVTRCLLAGADPNAGAASYNYTPLHMTARRGDAEAVAVLLEAGADPNAGTGRGHTPLYFAATAEIVEALLEAGADPNVKTFNLFETPLHRMVWVGTAEIVAMLLEAGADPNAQTEYGEIPLHFAATAEIVAMLLEGGGRTRTRKSDTATPRCIERHGGGLPKR